MQCVIQSRNNETAVLYLSKFQNTHNCALPTVVFVYVSVTIHVCGCAGQSICRYVSECFELNLPLVCIATFTVSLELQGGECSDQLTLICRHSEAGTAPLWIHNWTLESGATLGDAFPGAVYTVLTRTEHTTTITGVDNVRALDGYFIQCVYEDLGNLTKSNAVKYSFIPPGQYYGCCMCTTYMRYMQYINSGNYYTKTDHNYT